MGVLNLTIYHLILPQESIFLENPKTFDQIMYIYIYVYVYVYIYIYSVCAFMYNKLSCKEYGFICIPIRHQEWV
jgi:hypothetical protein